MLKRFLFFVLFSFSCSHSLANTEFTYERIDGGLEITGCIETCPFDLVIPNSIGEYNVVRIGKQAFSNSQLTSVSIPDSVISIGDFAFSGNQLTSVTIPNSVTYIGVWAFDSNQLSSVVIPSSVEKIGNGAFFNNNIDVSNIFLEEGLKSIGDSAFGDQNQDSYEDPYQDPYQDPDFFESSTINLAIPDTVTSIGYDAFGLQNMPYVLGVEININIEASDEVVDLLIGSGFIDFRFSSITFTDYESGMEFTVLQDRLILTGCWGCSSDLIIPEYIDGYPVTDIGDNAFSGQGLNTVVIPNSVRTIGKYAFMDNQLESITFPESVTFIGDNAFQNNLINTLVIPDSVSNIGYAAFQNNHIVNVSIPDSVITLGSYAFEYNKITHLVIPESVIYMGVNVFDKNPISSVILTGGISSDYLDIFNRNEGVASGGLRYILVSGSAMITGCSDICPNDLIIPTKIDGYDVSSIGFRAFRNGQLTSVSIPNSVTYIGYGAFENNQIANVTIPDSLTTIKGHAFSTNQLTNILIPESVTSIGSFAFSNNQLTTLIIPDSLTSLGFSSFSSNQLTSVTIPDSVTSIESYAFAYNQLTDVTIPEGVISIGSKAFSDNKLTNVVIPDGLATIGDFTFSKNQLSSVTIPGMITHIKWYAFDENELTHLHFEGEPPKIDNTAFSSNALTSISYCQNNNGNWDNVIIEGITPLLDCDTDGVEDSLDAFPLDASESLDTDSDGIGNNTDADDDGDGVEDSLDVFPLDPSETLDTDADGIGNNADTDDDNDGKNDIDDLYPLNHLYHADSDSDNMPDAWELLFGLNPNDPTDNASDSDNDGIVALQEFFEGTPPGPEVTVVSNDLSWDFDQSGNLDALTDGLLLLRYAFGLRNESLTSGAISAESALSQAEVESNIEQALSIADIDNSGAVDALTDGLMLLRYAFGLRGESLISGAVSTQGMRNTATNIEAYIESHMP